MDGLAFRLFDVVLAALLIMLALGATLSPHLFRSVVLFVSFGLVTSLAWARLGAPDIAIVEAAIGAGLTGVIFLHAILLTERNKNGGNKPGSGRNLLSRPLVAVLGTAAAAVLFELLETTLAGQSAPGLALEVDAMLEKSGVSHGVTAVLLNFRGYDTLLEVGVLAAALAASLSFVPGRSAFIYKPSAQVAVVVSKTFLPFFIVISGYLLYTGSSAPGGGFQAGAVLGVGWVLLLLTGLPYPGPPGGTIPHRFLQFAGFAIFTAVAAAVMIPGGNMLEYPSGWGYWIILAIEVVLTVSIAFTLVKLFVVNIPVTGVGKHLPGDRGERG